MAEKSPTGNNGATSIRLTKSHSHISDPSSKLSQASSEELLHETKYVMLNFMSLVPPRLYKDHVHPSPEPSKHGTDHFSKSLGFMSKSKSFDVGAGRSHKQGQLHKMHALGREVDSPASEDNVNYRYQINQATLEGTPGSVNSEAEHFNYPLAATREQTSGDGLSSGETSPRKNPMSVYRLNSDTSSCGDYSYVSDADDEYEASHSSSYFSSASLNQKDGFLDLRRNSKKNLLVRSVSDYEEVGAGSRKSISSDVIPECQDEEDCIEGAMRGLDDGLDDVDGHVMSRPGLTDRSKLKLNIRPQQPVMLDDVLLSLQSELNSELDELESEYEEAIKSAREASVSPPPSLTPTQAAKILARIGDEVKEEYSSQITSTVNNLFFHKVSDIDYRQFKDISTVMIDNRLPGWRQVALLMVYGQSATWYAVKGGHKHIGNIVDHCSRLIFDVAADFIIKEGGWGSVMNFDPSQSSDTQSSADFDSPVTDFFTSHNATQVESSTMADMGEPNIPQDSDSHMSDNPQSTSTPFHSDEPNIPQDNDSHMSDNPQSTSTPFHSDQLNILPSVNPDTDSVQGNTIGPNQLRVKGPQTYKPSFGFDFRSSGTEGVLPTNPQYDDSIDFIMTDGVENGGQSGGEGRTLDSETNEEDVFSLEPVTYSVEMDGGQIPDRGDAETSEMFISAENVPTPSGYNLLEQFTYTTTSVIQPNRTFEEFKPHRNQITSENSDKTELETVEDNHKKTDANQNAQDNLDTEESQSTSTDNQGPPETGYFRNSATKLVLAVGAVAAVGLGIKLGAFNR